MNEIQQLQKILAKHSKNVIKGSLFGSRARGDNHDRSDFDVAIFLNSNCYKVILQDLNNLKSLLKVDVTLITPQNKNKLDKIFLDNIQKEEVLIYMGNYKNKYQNLIKAVATLKKVIDQDSKNLDNDLEYVFKDSLIQRFEFCYVLSLKTLKDYMIYEGYQVENSSPRSV
ncbi:MAG: nucleotidyltransferase substrate binding protein [bacterium]